MSGSMLTTDTVAQYIAGRPVLRDLVDVTELTVDEVGDGNLNLVFICRDGAGKAIVLKQSLPYVRLVGPEWPMTEDRAAREAHSLAVHGALAPEWVCALLEFNEEQHVLALEDLTDHEVLRTRLNHGGSHAGTCEPMGRLVARVLVGTSWIALGEEAFRLQASETVNTELCRISEELIFTEPYLGSARNSVRPLAEARVAALQQDASWVSAAMRMKRRFLTVQEALVHGDLHSGSMFVRGEVGEPNFSVKAFDSEFAFYGPIGFDLGLLWGNILAAAVRASVRGETERALSLLDEIEVVWEAFVDELRAAWPLRTKPEQYSDAFLDSWLVDILDDSWGFAGCEAVRRVIGLAKVSDIETLDDDEYERGVELMFTIGRSWLVDRSTRTFDEHREQFAAALQSVTV
ncbi:S-methyl-5-thioribose kinase [Glaciibacter psychrotolerans]|uniref:S-methyl-5-thioribose kinase n=1 Tax=Glaciibacter psychrotolerans TaxID=670054 RepID=A0A7Z0J740_9MICO|nr:S-methyl-5-thioribose kinase [Leifsonia psychrotolerans]NYJ20886.1 5-methylthioribose kinase [Leifsonia psychrotolerans]